MYLVPSHGSSMGSLGLVLGHTTIWDDRLVQTGHNAVLSEMVKTNRGVNGGVIYDLDSHLKQGANKRCFKIDQGKDCVLLFSWLFIANFVLYRPEDLEVLEEWSGSSRQDRRLFSVRYKPAKIQRCTGQLSFPSLT